ncbi:MAG TPA: Na+/H+ antiporter [Thermoleophilaceae bacterium]
MNEFGEVLLGLMVAVVALTIVARAINIPYPILLVLGGLVLGAVPGIPDVELDPDLVLVLFLPPLLYSAAFFSSLRDLRTNLRPISMLAIGLVAATMCVVAVVAHAVIDGLPWSMAFALGAIVAPTDPLAATTIARRLGVPRRLVTVLEGESLINDATALVAYRVAVGAAVSGSFSAWKAGPEFVWTGVGGIAVGLLIGWLVSELRARLEDPPLEVTISLTTAYAAYLPAEAIGVSGVLAAVTTGIVLGWRAPDIANATTRMQGAAVWNTLSFVLNALLFILIGLQLPVVLDALQDRSTGELVGYAAAVCGAVVGTRLLWGFTVPYVTRALDFRNKRLAMRAPWQWRAVSGWSGMRGSVSLAAALALPLETDAGAALPGRDLVIFLTFTVILFTLVVQGLTLPFLIRRLGVSDDGTEEAEEDLQARLAAAEAALARIEELAEEDWTRDDTVDRLRRMYDYRHRRFAARREGGDVDGFESRSEAYQRLLRELLNAQRAALVTLRKQGAISDQVMRRVERELDLEDTRLEI